ncbi:MAG: MXAN_5187 C-terminal domain-containing protein [Geoalkalibacter sp.]|jgi:hypothetical protein|uniref:MXAN_5187 C-terminal domain-containing protein n=1 Tax=Geoalkalibacter sp. TaxID=3041440 RepID=UPI002A95D4B4|nr:MXAN_5187 C-terminal domain-containing protein [Thermodesulfobacteriota bacterium]
MSDRIKIEQALHRIENDLRELQIHYEKFFGGAEKLEPIKLREGLAARLRHFANRKIMQTDLRFKYQTLAGRFHSYAGYWDRILRLMDEGRFVRGATGLSARPTRASRQVPDGPNGGDAEIDQLVQQLREAGGHSSGSNGQDREKVARFIEAQRERIKKTFGDRDVEFRVVIEGGKPKVKVRAKKP